VPDLNWELWRLRQSAEVARHLRREAALAARASIEFQSSPGAMVWWNTVSIDQSKLNRRECSMNTTDVWRSVESDGDRQLRRKGRDLADAARHVKDQLGSLARISDADESRRGLVRRALSQAGDLTTTLDSLAGDGST
jgi:hypothetical protein